MKDTIKKLCQGIEREHNISILFAVENGSRAWRIESKDSDYDVRFVFVRSLQDYIQIAPLDEVIEAHFDKNLNTCRPQGAFIDIVGFDIFKYARMLAKSNPTCIEWLVSDIIYYGRQPSALKNFALKHYNPKALYHHYKSMCKSNYLKYLKSKNKVTYKKYLYAYRGLVNAKWVVQKHAVPPIIFSQAAEQVELPRYVKRKLQDIIRLKSEGRENDIIQNIVQMGEYIENFLADESEAPKEKHRTPVEILNEELRKIVLSS